LIGRFRNVFMTDHMITLSSKLPEAKRRQSGLKPREFTLPV
jgi:hypothetical protein